MEYVISAIVIVIFGIIYNFMSSSLEDNRISLNEQLRRKKYYGIGDFLTLNEIRNRIDYIHNMLPDQPTAVNSIYKLPDHLKMNVTKTNYSQESIQEISNHINFFLGLLTPIKITIGTESSEFMICTKEQINTANRVGLYKVYGGIQREIHLTKKFHFEMKHILAILAHESTHNYLNYYNIKKKNEKENELLTDITAVYIGLGNLLLEGYRPVEYSTPTGNHITQIGYLKPQGIIYTMNYSAVKRNIIEIGHSLSIFQKTKIKNNIEREKKREKVKEEILILTSKIEFLENTYIECKTMYNKISINLKNLKFSQNESNILYEFSNTLASGDISSKLKKLKLLLKDQEQLQKDTKNKIEMDYKIIEEKISKWYLTLKKFDF